MAKYRFEIQRLVDDLGTGHLGGTANYEVLPGGGFRSYPLFDSEKAAEAFIVRKKMVARVQRYTVKADGSLGWTAGAGEIIDARRPAERGAGLLNKHPKRPQRGRVGIGARKRARRRRPGRR